MVGLRQLTTVMTVAREGFWSLVNPLQEWRSNRASAGFILTGDMFKFPLRVREMPRGLCSPSLTHMGGTWSPVGGNTLFRLHTEADGPSPKSGGPCTPKGDEEVCYSSRHSSFHRQLSPESRSLMLRIYLPPKWV